MPSELPTPRKKAFAGLPGLTDTRLYFLVFTLSIGFSLGGVVVGRGPIVSGGDEFAYLLGAQTFAAGRLTNPTPHHWEFFETFHVLMQPTYMSKYPPAQSLVLAVGYKLGHPIIGVWLSVAAFAVATSWLIRARFSRRWALLGGIICVIQFGGTHYYSQSYWGGAVAATGGALLIGGVLRLTRATNLSAALFLGLGVAVGLLSRPFETLLLCIVPGVLLLRCVLSKGPGRKVLAKHLFLGAGPVVLAALFFQARLNKAVTGDWMTLPYTAYEAQYSGSPLFVWEPVRQAPKFENPVIGTFYFNFTVPGSRFYSPIWKVWFKRSYTFFSTSLGFVLAIAALLGSLLRPSRFVGLLWLSLAISSLGFVLSYWFNLHYYAALHGTCILLAIHGFRVLYLSVRENRPRFAVAALAVIALCALSRNLGYDWNPYVGRIANMRNEVVDSLTALGGKHLVFVRRIPLYDFHFIIVHNDANIDSSRIVWAHYRGPLEDRKLIDYYGATRRAWLLSDTSGSSELLPIVSDP